MNSILKFVFLVVLTFNAPYLLADTIIDSLSQESKNAFRVDSIAIVGNDITKDVIILRELTFKRGDYITDDILDFNKERIYSLSLFTSVKVYPKENDSLNIVYIDVKESWYIWPIPFAYTNDGDFKKLSFGINLLYKNFRGRNESLSANFSFGYNPSYSLSYYNPYINREHNISFNAGSAYSKFANISTLAEAVYGKSFKYKYFSAWINPGKRLNIYNDVYLYLGYDYIEAPDSSGPNITASRNRIDNVAKAGINYFFDTRNLKQFPDSGVFFNLSYFQKGFGTDKINYSILNVDFRHYFRVIGSLTAKYRIASRMALGNPVKIPYYDLSFLGHGERVRGHSNDHREGHNSYIGSVEVKYPLIKEWDISFKLPIIPKQLTSYRIAVYPNLFFDTGTVQFRQSEIRIGNKLYRLKYNRLKLDNFYSGYGAGLIFLILPYNIVRLELAFDEHTKAEFNLGFGFSF